MGMDSDTLDVTGTVTKYPFKETYTEEKIKEVLTSFLGSYDQEVPLYSAVHVEGKRLYEYARSGEEVKLPSKLVTIQDIELLETSSMDLDNPTFQFKVSVSKGTYIRSLIRDIGKKLNCPCIMKNLIRTRQGKFLLEEALLLEDIKEDTPLLKIEEALKRIEEYDTIVVDKTLESKIQNGAVLPRNFSGSYATLLNEEQELLAIYQRYSKDENLMKPWKVFCKENEK
ncbi:MAG: pseudouridine synthase [Bacilli bacterium]|nr:pseudouridine synthase [Bacilli bacterium]